LIGCTNASAASFRRALSRPVWSTALLIAAGRSRAIVPPASPICWVNSLTFASELPDSSVRRP
jgi:hypothetical protein